MAPPPAGQLQGLLSPALGTTRGAGAVGRAEDAKATCLADPSQLAVAVTGQCRAMLGWAKVGDVGRLGSDTESSKPLLQGGPAAEMVASHMCKTHLVKINTGFVFSIKKKENKKPIIAF